MARPKRSSFYMGKRRGKNRRQPRVCAPEPDPLQRSKRQAQRWLCLVLHETGNPHSRNSVGVPLKTFQASGLTYQIGTDVLVRPQFETTGVLNNTVDREFRKIGDRWPIFAFAHDLGTVGMTKTTPVVYTVGYGRDPLVQLSNVPNVNSARSHYYLTRYPSTYDVVCPLYTSYVTVLT